MKRVVAFFDMFDKIPDNSKYLFSNKFEFPIEETEEQKNQRIISSNPIPEEALPRVAIYQHYYEVEDIDMEELVENKFFIKSPLEKMKEFNKEYKIPNKEDDKGQVRAD